MVFTAMHVGLIDCSGT